MITRYHPLPLHPTPPPEYSSSQFAFVSKPYLFHAYIWISCFHCAIERHRKCLTAPPRQQHPEPVSLLYNTHNTTYRKHGALQACHPAPRTSANFQALKTVFFSLSKYANFKYILIPTSHVVYPFYISFKIQSKTILYVSHSAYKYQMAGSFHR